MLCGGGPCLDIFLHTFFKSHRYFFALFPICIYTYTCIHRRGRGRRRGRRDAQLSIRGIRAGVAKARVPHGESSHLIVSYRSLMSLTQTILPATYAQSGGRLDAQGSSSSGSGSGSSNSLRRRDRFTHDEKALRCISHDVINMEIEPLIMANNGTPRVSYLILLPLMSLLCVLYRNKLRFDSVDNESRSRGVHANGYIEFPGLISRKLL